MAEISSRKPETEMHVAAEMRQSMIVLAGPRQPEDTRESMIARAARKAGISFRQAKTFFYGETDNPRLRAVERVRAAINNANARQEAKAREEYELVREQIALLEQRLAALDANGSRPIAAADKPRFIVDRSSDRPMDWGS